MLSRAPSSAARTHGRKLKGRRHAFATALLVCLLAVAGDSFSAPQPPKILEVRAVNLHGEKIRPFADQNARVFVFIFLRTDCPIANAYAPELQRLHERFAARATAFWLVYIDPEESAFALRDHLDQFRLRIPALHDTTHSLVQFCAPQRTPEAVVFSRDFRKVYSGRIDDRFTAYGKQKERATTHDLADAIEATLDNRRVTESKVPAVGCPIVDLR
jgi:hypothetical protein